MVYGVRSLVVRALALNCMGFFCVMLIHLAKMCHGTTGVTQLKLWNRFDSEIGRTSVIGVNLSSTPHPQPLSIPPSPHPPPVPL